MPGRQAAKSRKRLDTSQTSGAPLPCNICRLGIAWPDEPRVYQRTPGDLDRVISASVLQDHVETGCIPADEIAVIKAPHPSLSQKAFQENGRTDAARLRTLYGQGFTIRIGNLQRVMPAMARLPRHPAGDRILRPAEVTGPGLTAQIRETRDALVRHLTNLDPESIAKSIREAALTELEYTT
jgi:hypothetical protein